MKPTKGIIQWIAPHLSEGEVRALYEAVLSEVIGEDEKGAITNEDLPSYGEPYENSYVDRDDQRAALAKLFGRDNK